jgi:CRISPR/Cas system-associated protein endoribonuclease Cas2
VIKRGFITLGELEIFFSIYSQIVFDWEILGQSEMRFEKSFKSYSNDQWLLCREQTWFNMAGILHALILNQNIIDEMILIILRNWLSKG